MSVCIALVSREFNIPIDRLLSSDRKRHIARPRQIAMYLCRRHTPHSFPEIGHAFADRDHTTVMYAVTHIEALMAKDPVFAAQVRALAELLS